MNAFIYIIYVHEECLHVGMHFLCSACMHVCIYVHRHFFFYEYTGIYIFLLKAHLTYVWSNACMYTTYTMYAWMSMQPCKYVFIRVFMVWGLDVSRRYKICRISRCLTTSAFNTSMPIHANTYLLLDDHYCKLWLGYSPFRGIMSGSPLLKATPILNVIGTAGDYE